MGSSYTPPGGGIGGTTGTTDNAITRADGTGGSTLQGSLATIDDDGSVITTGGFAVGGNPIVSTGKKLVGGYFLSGNYAFFQAFDYTGNAYINLSIDGLTTSINTNSNGVVNIGSGGISFAGPAKLVPDAANTLAQRNGANGQTWIVSRTFTDASNKSEASLVCTGTVAAFTITEAGTGIGALTKWTFNKNVSLPTLNISAIPTSSSGLSSGDVWSNLGILTIVP